MPPRLIYLALFVVLFRAVFSFDEESCDLDIPTKCAAPLAAISDKFSIDLQAVEDKEAAAHVCNALRESLSCIESFIARCSSNKRASAYDTVINSTKNLINKKCQGIIESDASVPDRCFAKYSSMFRQRCDEPFQRQLKLSKSLVSTEMQLKSVCKSFKDFQVCTKNLLYEYCGEETVEYVEKNVFRPMSTLDEQIHCTNNITLSLEGFKYHDCTKQQTGDIIKTCFDSLGKALDKAESSKNKEDRIQACRSYGKFKVCVRRLILHGCNVYNQKVFNERVFDELQSNEIIFECSNRKNSASSLVFSSPLIPFLILSSIVVNLFP